jgi:hypothetical protein
VISRTGCACAEETIIKVTINNIIFFIPSPR